MLFVNYFSGGEITFLFYVFSNPYFRHREIIVCCFNNLPETFALKSWKMFIFCIISLFLSFRCTSFLLLILKQSLVTQFSSWGNSNFPALCSLFCLNKAIGEPGVWPFGCFHACWLKDAEQFPPRFGLICRRLTFVWSHVQDGKQILALVVWICFFIFIFSTWCPLEAGVFFIFILKCSQNDAMFIFLYF